MQQRHLDSLVGEFMSVDPETAYGKAEVQLNTDCVSMTEGGWLVTRSMSTHGLYSNLCDAENIF